MSQEIRKILATNIYKHRTKVGYSKEALSLALGFDNSYISKVERKRVNVTIDRLAKIAEALGIPVKDLFEEI